MKLFRPELNIEELSSLVEYQPCLGSLEKQNDELYGLLSKLTEKGVHNRENEYDKRDKGWDCFYLPVRRRKTITVPVSITEYNNGFFVSIKNVGYMAVEPGKKDIDQRYNTLFEEILKFIPLLQESENQIAYRTTPFDIRTGKILGKHILKDLLPQEEKDRLLAKYKEHQKLGMDFSVSDISLERYLETAGICYKAAFPEEAQGKTSLEMYDGWADGRHGGMLNISEKTSKEEFLAWEQGEERKGCHPFEIVYSPFGHGIHLYPPNNTYEDRPFFELRVTDKVLTLKFVKMAEALIDSKIPFRSDRFESTLDYLSGDSYFSVNRGYGLDGFHYFPSKEHKKRYFNLIEWDDLEFVKWK